MAEWMQMSELAEAHGFDVFALRDGLEGLGLLTGGPSEIALNHGFAVEASGDAGGMMVLWHRDVITLLGGSRLPEQLDLFGTMDFLPGVEADNACSCEDLEDGSDNEYAGGYEDRTALSLELAGVASTDSRDVAGGSAQSTGRGDSPKAQHVAVRNSVRSGNPVGKVRSGFDAVIATDGACKGNPGPGGWAWVEQLTGDHESGGASHTTNNIMELTAIIRALEYLGPEMNVLLRIDSQYVINAMTKWAPGWRKKGWKKADGQPVANRELVEHLFNLYEERTGRTEVEWVKGHNGDAANELVDSLAVEESKRYV